MRSIVVSLALALWFALTCPPPTFGTVAFSVVEEFVDSAANPQAVTLADVTGDGIDDAIVVDIGDSVVVFFNDGQGVLEEDGFYDTGEVPVAVATGLFNADAFVDIVVVNNVSGTVSVLYNDGEGFFDAEDSREFLVGARPIGIAVADFNHDAVADLAVLSPGLVYMLQGNGDGTFSAFNPATFPTQSGDSFAIAAGTLTSDATVDLAVTNRANNQVGVFLGNGDGTFDFNGFTSIRYAPTGLVIADADQNQTNDLIVAASRGEITAEITLLQNYGEGRFAPELLFTGPEEPLAITSLDVEPDGKVDLAITSVLGGEIFVLCQPSDVCVGEPREAGIWRSAIGGTVRGCSDVPQVAIVAGKLNADDKDDFVALKGEDDFIYSLCVALNESTVATPTAPPVGTATSTRTATPTPTQTPVPTSTVTPTPTRRHSGDSGCSIGGEEGAGGSLLLLAVGAIGLLARSRFEPPWSRPKQGRRRVRLLPPETARG